MIGFHFQRPIDDWPAAATRLPDGAIIKTVDNVQMLRDVKAINPRLHTNLRHHVGQQSLPAHPADFEKAAKQFFDSFVDGTFRQYAEYVDSVSEYNEYFGNGQDQTERVRWIMWAIACAKVWERDFRSQADYRHIRLVLAETAVGNDIPVEVARAAHDYDCYIGYHPYVPMADKKIMPSGVTVEGRYIDEWQYYSGRWTFMDERYRENGIFVKWFFGETGPVRDASGSRWRGHLQPNDGWRHPNCCDGDIASYLQMIDYWSQRTSAWNKKHGNRALGGVLFTSGGGSDWKHFETRQPEMNVIASYVANHWPPDDSEPPVIEPPPDPEPIPPATVNHTVHLLPQDTTEAELALVTAYFHPTRSMFTYSADAAHAVMWHDPERRLVHVWDGERWPDDIYAWFAARGVGTMSRRFSEIAPKPPTVPFAVIVDDLPKHPEKSYGVRSLNDVDVIVVHHSAVDADVTIHSLASYHVDGNGWPGIGYHFCIEEDGGIYQVNWLETRSYHAGGQNHRSVGICLLGNFQQEAPASIQLEALRFLIDYLQKGDLSHVGRVLPHRALNQTACPGNSVDGWWEWGEW